MEKERRAEREREQTDTERGSKYSDTEESTKRKERYIKRGGLGLRKRRKRG